MIKDVPIAASARAFQIHPRPFQSHHTNIGTLFLATSRSQLTLFSVDYTMNMAWYPRLLEFLRTTRPQNVNHQLPLAFEMLQESFFLLCSKCYMETSDPFF
jgi:hypothetical protein